MLPLDLKLSWSASLSLWLDDRGGVLWVEQLKSCRILHIPPNPQGMQHVSSFWTRQHKTNVFLCHFQNYTTDNLTYTTTTQNIPWIKEDQRRSYLFWIQTFFYKNFYGALKIICGLWDTITCSNIDIFFTVAQLMSFNIPLQVWLTFAMNSLSGLWYLNSHACNY